MDPTETPVRAVRDVGPSTIALDLEPPAGFAARPGQFVKLSLDVGGERRSRFYTLSSPDAADALEVTVEINPDGDLGPHLAELESGATLTMAGPFGNAYYEDEPHTVILAGGPGVGPAVGIAERTLDDGGETAIVYRDDEPAHRKRLDALSERGARVAIVGADEELTPPVERALAGERGDGSEADDRQLFVYGFADFLDAATDAVAAAGGDPDRAKVENFG
jgi:3-phenylpropionate/trans-cinnamate dioxygenase ferredoxin reductase subunit